MPTAATGMSNNVPFTVAVMGEAWCHKWPCALRLFLDSLLKIYGTIRYNEVIEIAGVRHFGVQEFVGWIHAGHTKQ